MIHSTEFTLSVAERAQDKLTICDCPCFRRDDKSRWGKPPPYKSAKTVKSGKSVAIS